MKKTCSIAFFVILAVEALISSLSLAGTVLKNLQSIWIAIGVLSLVFLALSMLFAILKRWLFAAAFSAVFGALSTYLGLLLIGEGFGVSSFWKHYAHSLLLFIPALINFIIDRRQQKKRDMEEYIQAKKEKLFS